MFLGRNGQEQGMAKGKIEIDIDMCKGCGLCLAACKFGVTKLSKQGQANKSGYRYLVAAHPEQDRKSTRLNSSH